MGWMRNSYGWIGVDLDGTLAHYTEWKGPDHIGEPVPLMMAQVRKWITDGREVRIFTARACLPEQIAPVEAWLERHGIGGLKVTNVKDFSMTHLYDDRCVQVRTNTGQMMVSRLLEACTTSLELFEMLFGDCKPLCDCIIHDLRATLGVKEPNGQSNEPS